jgi:hypothetical protein
MRRAVTIAAALAVAMVAVAQMPWREYEGDEYNNFPAPSDYKVPAEYVFGRLMYPAYGGGGGFGRRGFRDWRQGGRTAWTNDYPRADRHLLSALRRLTRVDARSVEQPINLEDGDDIYNWPMLYMVRAGFADLDEEKAAKLRDYIARGGFLIGDDMWGLNEWAGFAEQMHKVLPGRDFNEIPDADPMWHIAFDLTTRYQILGQWSRFNGGQPLNQGYVPHWRGIWDEKKDRLIVAGWVNNDTGDSWEWADDPSYPEKYSALGIRMIVNHILYAMSH